jgi:hypothetical protein
VFIRYPPARIRYEGDQPVALLGVRIAPSYRLVDLPLGTPTTSARSERGTWALYSLDSEVVVVHPGGAGPACRPTSRPRSAAWPPGIARASWTGRPPRPSSNC